jgi:hypothetical protein
MGAKKGCLFCAIDTALNMARATGINIPMPKPTDHGRTQEEYDDYMKRLSSRPPSQSLNHPKQKTGQAPGTQQNPSIQRPGQPYEFSDDHIGELLKSFDPNEPPVEFEEMLSDDFFIKASVPGPLNDKMVAMIEKEVKRLFTTIVYLKTQGSAWERYFRDPDEPTGPQGVFPQM